MRLLRGFTDSISRSYSEPKDTVIVLQLSICLIFYRWGFIKFVYFSGYVTGGGPFYASCLVIANSVEVFVCLWMSSSLRLLAVG
jgi:hypothetical protein